MRDKFVVNVIVLKYMIKLLIFMQYSPRLLPEVKPFSILQWV